jgi:hypothetical protein
MPKYGNFGYPKYGEEEPRDFSDGARQWKSDEVQWRERKYPSKKTPLTGITISRTIRIVKNEREKNVAIK